MPSSPTRSLSIRKVRGLRDEYEALAKFAAAIILNRRNKANAVRPLLTMKRRQPCLVVARWKTIIDALLHINRRWLIDIALGKQAADPLPEIPIVAHLARTLE